MQIIHIHIANFRRTHVGNSIVLTLQHTFVQKFGDNLILCRAFKANIRAAQAVFAIGHQLVQGDHAVLTGHVSGDMVRIGDAHIGGSIGCDIGDDIIVDTAVIGVKPQIHGDIGIQRLKIRNGFLVNIRLGHVGIILGPEGDLVIAGGVEFLRYSEGNPFHLAVAAGKYQCQQHQNSDYFFHPLVPPLATPAMIFLWKIKNRMISGTEITTTAAIMAGIFSRPKPFSRIS